MSRKNRKFKLSRRRFLGQSSCAALGYTTLLSTLVDLKKVNAASMANSAITAGEDYKALVCIMLDGGNDSFNMLIPTESDEYGLYAVTRSNLAIPQNDILQLQGVQYGVHPSMTGVQSLYNNGDLAFIANIGTLIEPVTKQQLYQGMGKLPLGLFSHSDQARQWQTSIPHERTAIGWGGKIADLLGSMNTNQSISMNISLGGSSVFQTGQNTIAYSIDPYDGSVGIEGYDEDGLFGDLRRQSLDGIIDAHYEDIFKRTYVDIIRNSRDAHVQFSTAIDGIPDIHTAFSDNDFSAALSMVARTIAARDTLNMSRQIFFIRFGGWDHHDEVLNAQSEMLGIVSNGLTEFNTALKELNIHNSVTTFTMSEFGRTLTSNGNGTDHAWGGNVMVMGGAVNGGQIYGQYPTLDLNSDLEVGGGVLIPTLSADEYFSELSMWYGVQNSELPIIFPNLGHFYAIGSQNLPIGFMNI